MKRCIPILLASAVLIASAGGAGAQNAAPPSADGGANAVAGSLAMSACSDYWTLKSDDEIDHQTETLDRIISSIGAHDEDILQSALDEIDSSQKEIDSLNQQINVATPAAMFAAAKTGLEVAPGDLIDPAAQKRLLAATQGGAKIESLFTLLSAADARNAQARSAAYNLIARIQGLEAVKKFAYSCAKDQKQYLKDSGKGAGSPPPSTGPAAGLNPVGVWQHFEKGQLAVTLTITGGPGDFGGPVVWNLGLNTLAGTISVRQQSEGVFAGSLTNRARTEGVKMTLAQDGKTMTLSGKGTGQIIFTRQK